MIRFSVCFSSSNSAFGFIIRETEKRPFNHVSIKYVCPVTSETIIAHASHGFVHEVNESSFLAHNKIEKEYVIDCSKSDFLKVLTFIKKNLGVKYSIFQIIVIFFKKLIKLQFKEVNKDKYYICSEFGAYVCSLLNVVVPSNLDYITPSDLDKILTECGVENVKLV